MRPDDLAIDLIKGLMDSVPQLTPERIDDVIVGNAVPEAEQGLQFGRIIAARAIGIDTPGITINRYCASGLESIAIATAKIRIVTLEISEAAAGPRGSPSPSPISANLSQLISARGSPSPLFISAIFSRL